MNSTIVGLIIILIPIILLGLLGYFIYAYAKIHFKYKEVIDLDSYKEKVKKETEKIINDNNLSIKSQENKISDLSKEYSEKRNIFEELLKTISLYDDQIEIMSYGLYKPHFDFDTSEKYKEKLEAVREKEKMLIKDELAVVCSINWTVNGSASEGKKETKHYMKLMLRAFNGECDALISDVRWNNVEKYADRLLKSAEAINKLGSVHQTSITKDYFKLKSDELILTYEYQEKLHKEKEEQRRIQQQIREEEKAQRDYEKAIKDAEEEEKRNNKALEQARKELESVKDAERDKLLAKIANLEKEVQEAMLSKERAKSMAEQTKAGHVYVISNIGSFGENVFKIGMTRRLEPMDRVRELGDASVPFNFDVHAIIQSDNAPLLENELHKQFDNNKVNLINDRREFFHVSIDEIENMVKKYKADIEIVKVPEAREYRETEAIRNKIMQTKTEINTKQTILSKFPASL